MSDSGSRAAPSAEIEREAIRERYATAARAVSALQGLDAAAVCCGPTADEEAACCSAPVEVHFGPSLYAPDERDELPAPAVLASLGCGNPIAVADLAPGETVLDFGSGGGIDVILSARRVGPSGRAYGLDMTDEMLDLARHNSAEAGTDNAEFLKGDIEDVPLPDASVDVVISNCVINLSLDKPAVFAEMFRVLRPCGRIGVTDVVAEDRLRPEDRARLGDRASCIAGALSVQEYEAGLLAAGFVDVSVTFTHQVADGLHGAIVRASKPA